MIRIIYRWQVQPKNFDQFREAWSVATNKIHQSATGARGSFMLQGHEDTSMVLTIAKWDTLEGWEEFWGVEIPKEMKTMHALGKRISAEVYEEIDDFTR